MEIKYAIRKHDRLLHGNTELTSIVCHRQALMVICMFQWATEKMKTTSRACERNVIHLVETSMKAAIGARKAG
jgi:hypothetical protein